MHMTAGGNWEWLMLLYCKHNISGPCNKSCAVLDTIGCLSSGNITQFTNSHDSQGFGQADQYLWSWTSLPPSRRVWCHQNVQPGAAPSTANATLTLWTRPKGIRAFAPKPSSVLKAEITVRKSENACSHCQSHLSLPITAHSLRCNTETQASAGETDSSTVRQLLHDQDHKLNCLRQNNISEH